MTGKKDVTQEVLLTHGQRVAVNTYYTTRDQHGALPVRAETKEEKMRLYYRFANASQRALLAPAWRHAYENNTPFPSSAGTPANPLHLSRLQIPRARSANSKTLPMLTRTPLLQTTPPANKPQPRTSTRAFWRIPAAACSNHQVPTLREVPQGTCFSSLLGSSPLSSHSDKRQRHLQD